MKLYKKIDFFRVVLFSIIFILIGLAVFKIRSNILYFYLFLTIGLSSSGVEFLKMAMPRFRQRIRVIFQFIIGFSLLIFLSFFYGVNFQFTQIFFDIAAGVTTGALIQLIIARVIVPFFYGNIFCSQVCWDGALFEFFPNDKTSKKPKKRSEILAFSYIVIVIALVAIVSRWWNPATNGLDIETNIFERRGMMIFENIVILLSGLFLIKFWGKRSYCKHLCPFITISSLFSKFSIFKIAKIDGKKCSGCGRCNRECPMGIDVMKVAYNQGRVTDKMCIMCERCVSVCDSSCLQMKAGNPFK